ncbi:hypothetical protein MAR_021158 [Mya arenaria]|uniref:Uncharacterized protein n=1 Tax=Mya arenaria TaxID=6604 RepID=A0ABY7E9C9_MYAAR|nr:hypothetical protein MAR_021158 [Mya arenaria]
MSRRMKCCFVTWKLPEVDLNGQQLKMSAGSIIHQLLATLITLFLTSRRVQTMFRFLS